MVKVALKAQGLLKILAKKNKSQNWLAFRMQISSGYMSQLMTGMRHPSPKMREKMLTALPNHTFDELFRIENCSNGRNAKAQRRRAY